LPFGVLCVPSLSFVVYLLAWGARMGLRSFLRKRAIRALPLSPARLEWLLTRVTRAALWSGSYTLLELAAPGGLRVYVRLI
jgi:hypothetical protein